MKWMWILVAAALVGLLPAKAQAQYNIAITNTTDFGVWVTIYGDKGRNEKLGYTCAKGQSVTNLNSPKPYVFVLGEVKFAKDHCNGSNKSVEPLLTLSGGKIKYEIAIDRKTVVHSFK